MKYLALVCCLGLSVAACDGGSERRSPLPQPSPVVPLPPEPAPPPALQPPLPPGTQLIGLGEKVKEKVSSGADKNYAIAVPADGTLIVHLTWADTGGAFTVRLKVNGTEVSWRCGEFSPWPVEGRVQVVAGQQVWIAIRMGAGCWDYTRTSPLAEDTGAEFELTTSMN